MASFDELYGVIIRRHGITPFPTAILRYFTALGLTPQEVWLLLEFLSYRWTVDAPYPSLARLARERGLARPTIQRFLAGLQEKGLVGVNARHQTSGRRTSNKYHLEPLFARLAQLIVADEQTGGDCPYMGSGLPIYGQGLPTGMAYTTTEQATLPAPAQGKVDGAPGEEDSSEEDSFEEEDPPGLEKNDDDGELRSVLFAYCAHFRLLPVRFAERVRADLEAFAATRGRTPADVIPSALRALTAVRPPEGETAFWRLLTILCPPKEANE